MNLLNLDIWVRLFRWFFWVIVSSCWFLYVCCWVLNIGVCILYMKFFIFMVFRVIVMMYGIVRKRIILFILDGCDWWFWIWSEEFFWVFVYKVFFVMGFVLGLYNFCVNYVFVWLGSGIFVEFFKCWIV